MHWERKARIQRMCALIPAGDQLYVQIQRGIGSLPAEPSRIGNHILMMRMLADHGFSPEGAACLEVGTGHHPTLPLLFHLAGARRVVTVDLHRRIQWRNTAVIMRKLASRAESLAVEYEGLIDPTAFMERSCRLEHGADDPQRFFESIGIQYVAPGDASRLPDPDRSFDLHFSSNVLEHVEPGALRRIVLEGHRLLAPNGVACHIIDPSDHFAQSDSRIALSNFLRYTEEEWSRIAGNEFAYHNRLRAPDLLTYFTDAQLQIVATRMDVDERSVTELVNGFPLADRFRGYTPEQNATKTVCLLAVA